MHVVVTANFEIKTVVDCKEITPATPIEAIRGIAKEQAIFQLKMRLVSNCKIIGEPTIKTMEITL